MTLADIKNLIQRREYRFSEKVREMEIEGEFTRWGVLNCVLTADRIYKTERDELKKAVDGKKHTIIGHDESGLPFYTTGKVLADYRGRFYFFITAHAAD